jgi:hypothetical protein
MAIRIRTDEQTIASAGEWRVATVRMASPLSIRFPPREGLLAAPLLIYGHSSRLAQLGRAGEQAAEAGKRQAAGSRTDVTCDVQSL